MRLGIISTNSEGSQALRGAAELLRARGITPVATFYRNVHGTNAPRVYDDSNTFELAVDGGSEGTGFFLNRCVEIALAEDLAIDKFLVVGQRISTATARAIFDAMMLAEDPDVVVLGMDASPGTPTKSIVLRYFRRHFADLPSLGGSGFLMFAPSSWKRLAGFPEDVGNSGVELHFALDNLDSGGEVRIVPTSHDGQPPMLAGGEHLHSGLIAITKHGGKGRLAQGVRLVLQALLPGRRAVSLSTALRQIYLAREILMSRRFLNVEGDL